MKLDMISALVGLVAGLLTWTGTFIAIMKWRRKKRIKEFHSFINPILSVLKNGLGAKLNQDNRRLLVMQCTKLASRASFGSRMPIADPDSINFANQTFDCVFCGYRMKADQTGSCTDCGLGCEHWKLADPDVREGR